MNILIPKLILFPKRIVTVDITFLNLTQSYTNKFFISELKEDLRNNGLLCPLVVSKERRLIDGNHRYEAMKDDYTHIVAYEIAQNTIDKRLFGRDGSNNIFEFGINPTSIATGAITATGTVTANSQLASSNLVATGGSVNGIVIGASTAAAITGTLITANTNFAGNITGNVTGNVTGNITGNTTGDLTGNVTAGSGTSTFNNLVINGTVDFNTAVLTDLGSPSNSTDAATKGYVDTEITNLIGGAPGALDTLNELAAALNDDASFNSTITTSIAAKLPLAGGTMSGAIAMGSNKVTGLTNGSASGDAVNKGQLDTMLPLAGGTMTGNIAIGSNVITSSANPTDDTHLARKAYVDSQLGSATAAATSAAAAATSATASASVRSQSFHLPINST